MRLAYLVTILSLLFLSCRQDKDVKRTIDQARNENVRYARGFDYTVKGDTTVLEIGRAWPGAEQTFRYYLVRNSVKDTPSDSVIQVPLRSVVVTSTTHIPSLDLLGVSDKLVGFPNMDYISSKTVRSLIDSGNVREVGNNETLNTEVLVDLDPGAVVGFALDGVPSAYTSLEKTGIPVFYNADWTETHPLGKAEWIKFFGLLFGKEKQADSIFTSIVKRYEEARSLARKSKNVPTVLSGAMYRDIWYCPAGDSWAAQFLSDANADYLWKESEGTGSLSLSIEAVLEKAQQAEYWIGPGQFSSLEDIEGANEIYDQFEAFKQGNVFSFSKRKGPTGGVIYYELAPNRPDLVLKDLIAILHPELLPEHEFQFFDRLE